MELGVGRGGGGDRIFSLRVSYPSSCSLSLLVSGGCRLNYSENEE